MTQPVKLLSSGRGTSQIGREMRRSAFRARFSSFKVKLVQVYIGDATSSEERREKASIGKYQSC